MRVRSRSTYIARSPEEDVRERVVANVFHASVKSDFDIDVVRYFTPVNGNPETRDDEVFSTTYIPSDTVICTTML